MSGHHVVDVIFERRDSGLDRRDRKLVVVLQGRHAMPPRLRLAWRDPVSEPLLWLPDIVAGAKVLAERGDGRFWEQLEADMLVRREEIR
jgi:hypothetical protein